MRPDKSLIEPFRAYVSSEIDHDPKRPAWIIGDDVITLSWDRQAIDDLDDLAGKKAFIKKVNKYLSPFASYIGPASLKDARWQFRLVSPLEFNPDGYFKECGLKYTLYKTGFKSDYKFAKESLKKHYIESLTSMKDAKEASLFTIDLVPGKKFALDDFIRGSFRSSNKNDWTRIIITADRIES